MKIRAKKILKYIVAIPLVIISLILINYMAAPVWKHFVTYPGLETEIAAFKSKYKKPKQFIPIPSYKGAMHAHSYWSHDSRGSLDEIVDAANQAKLDFIFLSDHPHGHLDRHPRGYHGEYNGIIIESGTEYSSGLMVNPFDSVQLDWSQGEAKIMKSVAQQGGLVTYVHSEEPHQWDNPFYHAMEIYNIHTDVLDEDGILPFLINNAINGEKYMQWCYREFYDDQLSIQFLWDTLNLKRKIVGIGAVDAHNNHSFKARYLENGLVEWVGPNADTISIKKENWLDRLLLGKPDKYGWAFRWDLDSYFHSFNHVANHVFSNDFTNTSIKNHIIKGHLYVSFESLVGANGFQFFSTDSRDKLSGILGDSVTIDRAEQLHAVSPYPVKFQLLKNGHIIEEKVDAYQYAYAVNSQPGNYRLTALIYFNHQWTTWVLTNPIYVH